MDEEDDVLRARLEAVERWYEALAGDDLPTVLSLCTPDVEIRYPGDGRLRYGGVWQGHQGLVRWAGAHDEAEEILDFRIETTVAQADRVVVLGRFEGRARDTGRSWQTEFVHALTVRDGQVAGMQAHFDTATAVEAHRAVAGEAR